MASITGEPCAKELPVVQLVVSRDDDLIKLSLEGIGAVVQRTVGHDHPLAHSALFIEGQL